jgi:hypothetical protein
MLLDKAARPGARTILRALRILAAGSESATTANRCLIPSRVFPLRLEESDFLSDGASSGALPVINDDAANMACGGGRRFLPVPAGINPPCSFVALPPNVN